MPSGISPFPTEPPCSTSGSTITINHGLTSDAEFISISFTITGFKNARKLTYLGYFSVVVRGQFSTIAAQTPDSTYRVTLGRAKMTSNNNNNQSFIKK